MSIQYYQEKMYDRNLLWHREDISCSGRLLLFCTIYKQYLHVKVHCARKGHSKLNYTSNEKQNVRSDQSSSSSLPRTTWRIGMNMYILQEKIWNGKDGGTRKLNTFYRTCSSENIKLLKTQAVVSRANKNANVCTGDQIPEPQNSNKSRLYQNVETALILASVDGTGDSHRRRSNLPHDAMV